MVCVDDIVDITPVDDGPNPYTSLTKHDPNKQYVYCETKSSQDFNFVLFTLLIIVRSVIILTKICCYGQFPMNAQNRK